MSEWQPDCPQDSVFVKKFEGMRPLVLVSEAEGKNAVFSPIPSPPISRGGSSCCTKRLSGSGWLFCQTTAAANKSAPPARTVPKSFQFARSCDAPPNQARQAKTKVSRAAAPSAPCSRTSNEYGRVPPK